MIASIKKKFFGPEADIYIAIAYFMLKDELT